MEPRSSSKLSQPVTPTPDLESTPDTPKHSMLRKWFRKKTVVLGVIGLAMATIVGIGATDLKYLVVGSVYHGSLRAKLVEGAKHTPLVGVKASIGGKSAVSDKNGRPTAWQADYYFY